MISRRNLLPSLASLMCLASLTALAPSAQAQAQRPRTYAGRVASVAKDGTFMLSVPGSKKYPQLNVKVDRKAEWSGEPRRGGKVKAGDPLILTGVLTGGINFTASKVIVQNPNERPTPGGGPSR